MEKRRKHRHIDSSFSAGFLLCTDHNTFVTTFVMYHISKVGLLTVVHMIYSFELKVTVGVLGGLRTRLNH